MTNGITWRTKRRLCCVREDFQALVIFNTDVGSDGVAAHAGFLPFSVPLLVNRAVVCLKCPWLFSVVRHWFSSYPPVYRCGIHVLNRWKCYRHKGHLHFKTSSHLGLIPPAFSNIWMLDETQPSLPRCCSLCWLFLSDVSLLSDGRWRVWNSLPARVDMSRLTGQIVRGNLKFRHVFSLHRN